MVFSSVISSFLLPHSCLTPLEIPDLNPPPPPQHLSFQLLPLDAFRFPVQRTSLTWDFEKAMRGIGVLFSGITHCKFDFNSQSTDGEKTAS